MAPTFYKLPNGLLIKVYKKLSLADQIRLSSTDRRLRCLGIDEAKIFKSLSLTWSSRAASDSALLVAARYGSQVRKLTVYVDEIDGQHYVTPPTIPPPAIPASCVALLSGQDETGVPLPLPNLEGLALEFPKTYQTIYDMYRDTSAGKPQLQANNELVDAILKAAAARGSTDLLLGLSPITSLKLGNFPLHPSRVLASDDWQRFAALVEKLEMSVYGDDDDDISTIFQRPYFRLMRYLNRTIMRTWPSVTTVKFHAHSTSPAGALSQDFPDQNMLLWEPSHMPRLAKIELANVFITRQLLAFVTALGRVSLTILEARGDWNRQHNTGHQISWAQFFNSLAQIGLADFTLKPVRWKISDDHSYWMSSRWPIQRRNAAVMTRLATNPSLPIFPYFEIGESDGLLSQRHETTTDEFLRGQDQQAYEWFVDEMAKAWGARVELL
ncbi:hypothetical protein GGTG_07237 [Gaeumannomyces tritici R3-111a-1]|uniref:F-box domain-containing protein n=1 Tax=Gaeumannomyces tritici (strain R3-111a-1) TaxID=644352 RepID=J3P140_GAET3|nr:hypothetical protein GGTG_07237 [Gaeumannomyces tritici R3-111a-1]EJT77325.1 hypothetical protein GGTG_07237 [Gaeumannomyces tritici R3-111a-1]